MARSKTSLSRTQVWFLIRLGVPSFGLTFAVTVVAAYLPVILQKHTSPLVIGSMIGAEGFFGLFMPLIFGVLADRAHMVGERLRYLVPATGFMIGGLVMMGILTKIWLLGIAIGLFYVGYFAYLAPYWAIYPDLIPRNISGRARSAEGAWRIAGSMLGLISGGFLLKWWQPLPFVLAAALVAIVTISLYSTIRPARRKKIKAHHGTIGQGAVDLWRIIRYNHNIRRLIIANSFWNFTLQAIEAFVVLFFTVGLQRSPSFVSGIIFPITAIGLFIMAALAGRLADAYGHVRVLSVACIIYAAGVALPGLLQSFWLMLLVPLVSGAAATVMILPESVLIRLLQGERHGSNSGLFGFSRGLGSLFGPLVAGLGITYARNAHWFSNTHGYAIFWLICSLALWLSLPFLFHLQVPREKHSRIIQRINDTISSLSMSTPNRFK